MAEGDTLANALIGGAVAIFLSFLPLSPVLGGAVAGYLEGGERNDGARVGAIAGAVAFLPIVGLGVLVLGVGTFYVGSGSPFALGVGVLLLLLLFALVVAASTPSASARSGAGSGTTCSPIRTSAADAVAPWGRAYSDRGLASEALLPDSH